MKIPSEQGFTLIELLVIIAIIGALAVVVVVAVGNARSQSRLAKARADLAQLKTAIDLLAGDTGKWPNGCPTEETANPEVSLNQPAAGIVSVPPVGVVELPCEWTAEDVANWRGPYAGSPPMVDPWGTAYVFDADYQPVGNQAIVLLSHGPDTASFGALFIAPNKPEKIPENSRKTP